MQHSLCNMVNQKTKPHQNQNKNKTKEKNPSGPQIPVNVSTRSCSRYRELTFHSQQERECQNGAVQLLAKSLQPCPSLAFALFLKTKARNSCKSRVPAAPRAPRVKNGSQGAGLSHSHTISFVLGLIKPQMTQ